MMCAEALMRQALLGRATSRSVPLPAELGRSANYNFAAKPPVRDVPYVPTPDNVAAEMLRVAKVTSRDVVYDLRCGDGRMDARSRRTPAGRSCGVFMDRAGEGKAGRGMRGAN